MQILQLHACLLAICYIGIQAFIPQSVRHTSSVDLRNKLRMGADISKNIKKSLLKVSSVALASVIAYSMPVPMFSSNHNEVTLTSIAPASAAAVPLVGTPAPDFTLPSNAG